MAGLVNSQRL